MKPQSYKTTRIGATRDPSRTWGHPARYVTTMLRRGIVESIEREPLPAGSRALDFGCADRPYAGILSAKCVYVGADLPGNQKADVFIAPDGTLPLEESGFDLVLSTQVLEHARDPSLYLRECRRMLKPGGVLILSTHGMMIWHPDPNDFWRWTCEGLRLELESAGFEVDRFFGIMGLASTGLQFVQYAIMRRLPGTLRRPWCAMMQSLVALADRFIDRNARDKDALVFVVSARRPRA